ncbi:hypothetical protein [Vibrio cholerae]|uniref:hypothetical protein n=1 Tax=Vibrio cholerae TaxID=666 RepID=UPI0008415779|nr:hypothetical protein [Vibrio cholerae]
MFNFRNKTKPRNVVTILEKGLFAGSSRKDGRAIPYFKIDASTYSSFQRQLQLQQDKELPSDTVLTWGWTENLFDDDYVAIKIEFKAPTKTEITLLFDDLNEYCEYIEVIQLSNCFCLTVSDKSLIESVRDDEPGLIIDIPDTATFPKWAKIYERVIVERKRAEGLRRGEAKSKAKKSIKDFKTSWVKNELSNYYRAVKVK